MSERLECGTDVDRLTRQVFDGEPPVDAEHQRTCPHCRAALERIRSLQGDLVGVSREAVRVPDSVLRTVLARVRETSALVTIDVGPRGATTVRADTLAVVARRAAERVEVVSFVSVVATDALETGVVAFRVRLIVEYGPSLPAVADAVREAIRADITELTGATLRGVDVLIDDLAR